MGELTDHWVELRSATPSHLRVRLVALGGAVLFMLALALAGGGGWVAWTGIVVMGGLTVLNPTTLMPTLFVVFGVASWWAGVEGPWHWALLPAALGLLAVHASASLAASMPAQASLPGSVVQLWLVRTGIVAALTAGIWLLVALLAGIASPRGGAVPGIIGLVVLVAALVSVDRARQRA